MGIRIRFQKPKSLFVSWILSYIGILIITLIISMFAYIESVKAIQSETNKAYMSSLKQLQQAVDGTLKDIQRLSVEVSLNARISSLVSLKESDDNYDRVEMTKIINDLKTYKVANGFIDKFYIYFKNNDFIISSDAKYVTEDFFKINYADYDINFQQWKKMILDKHSQQYLPLTFKARNGNSKNNAAFMQSLPMTQRNANDATLVIEINEDAIRKAMEGLQWVSRGTIFIEDINDNILVSTRDIDVPKTLSYGKLEHGQDIFNGRIGKESVVISQMDSDITEWKYISVIPTSIFLERAKYVYRVFFTSIIMCIIVGVFIAYLLAKHNYNPVGKLIHIFNNKAGKFKDSGFNEYDFIEKSIIDIISEKEKVYNKLDQQKDVLKNNFLSRLIKGQLDNTISLEDACQSYDIKIDGKYYLVILFYLEDFTNLYLEKEKAEINSDESLKNVHFIVKNVIEDKISGFGNGYLTIVNDMPICLVSIKEGEIPKIKKELHTNLSEAKRFIENKFGIFFSAAMSDVHMSVNSIPRAYQEAIEAMEYKMLMGKNRIILYDEVCSSKECFSNHNSYSREEQQFMNCIKAGDYKSAKAELMEIFKIYFPENLTSIQLAKCRMFGLINIMLNVIAEVSNSFDNNYIESMDIANQLLSCKTIVELQNGMAFVLEQLDDYFSSRKEEDNCSTIKDIMTYIEDNYPNADLNVSMIADKFDMSIVYLSKFFKKHTGVGMLDYIHKFRIEKAKEILRDEKLSIKEIGEQVGYYNSAAFIRVFKKYEGITPGKHKGTF